MSEPTSNLQPASRTPLLDLVNSPEDLKKLPRDQLPQLAAELREEIVRVCSVGGLHLASSLGATDLIVALHYVLNSPRDRILFDVGHQAYAHKMLTGRRSLMHTVKKEGGLSGFTKVSESEHDAITVGHASTSLANALGMALARDALGQDYKVAALIGDGSLTGGMALAALNTIGDTQRRMLIVLNDNEMSISENVGAINKFMRGLQVQKWFQEGEEAGKKAVQAVSKPLADFMSRAKSSTRHFFDPASVNPFAAMGVRYVGPVDGHNMQELVWLIERLVDLDGPTILHVVTKKGKGLSYAEADPIKWHGPGQFDPATGTLSLQAGTPSSAYSWSSAFGDAVTELARQDPRTFVITPAMREGSGLVKYSQVHPHRYLDVGIAEDVAVTTAAGLALQGMRPIVAIYSTFLQRAYDQVLHDVAIENLNVTFAIDRGGIVGADGATHNGVFDLSFLRSIPNVGIGLPRDAAELRGMLKAAQENPGPFAIRYPRGNTERVPEGTWPTLLWGTWERVQGGDDVVILAGGKALEYALKATRDLSGVGVVNARFVKPLDEKMLREVAARARALVTVEDNTVVGGFGSAVLEALSGMGLRTPVRVLGIPDEFQDHATVESVHARAGIDAPAIRTVLAELGVDVPLGV
ncbi:1-deoxy-D-xylulose-5-phosphate synthase [Deinococcus metallilatus]|uniref:1-deoxy-D-xylulose-5-phosphate synthase n=1 Tax=Deinococcus metallilatus TaxID=1211322 RepID=A0AAJ5JZV3_9DEIO|nr:1-deoxy-D-xylulose-5-phosphate synthase [Deinococcus metallilatus]MBB5295124.1 1-deoxy-D-xylulose-5-phosphate synthase [Deinococcus metallilatus]QBY08697.1 1-deoxy-D-xylulose-5-phosphate synthase [Deinococcus metallilatus]RXJ10576.1 1-deoxy-D-xylulose-5-phosphate synthase [Deinococcus metallilatus]TLK26547.1 1-deoxy-D-xylulose-5-phosphate synthase [Deinococcus metallilatus]GMA14897.1 1-deoxy-D-xylulose-5-phosphate synthase [Deinococcus metallilatus]